MEIEEKKPRQQQPPPWPATHKTNSGFSPHKPKKNMYDLIQSHELDLLYKKNAHLLSRLSTTGKENTRLYTKISSLSKETSRLGDKNSLLENRFQNLKDQISLFARQHRAFNLQSQRLKQDLKKARVLHALAPENYNQKLRVALKAKEQALWFFYKKEEVYKKQIENLLDLRKKDKTQRQIEWANLKKEYENTGQGFEIKSQQNKIEGGQATWPFKRLNELQVLNRNLSQQVAQFEENNKSKSQEFKNLERQKTEALKDLEQLKAQAQAKHITHQAQSSQQLKRLNELQALNRNLSQQVAQFEESNKSKQQEFKNLERQKTEALKDLEQLKAQAQAKHITHQAQASQQLKRLNELQALNRNLSQQVAQFEESNKSKQQEFKNLERQKTEALKDLEQLKTQAQAQAQDNQSQIQEKTDYLNKTQTLLSEIELKARKEEKSNKKLQKELNHIQKKYENLKTQKQWVLKESKKIKAQKKEIQQLEKTQAKLPSFKNKIICIKKEKEHLKTTFNQQIHLLTTEKDSLKSQYDSMRKALLAGETGWKQVLFSFQEKYNNLRKQNNSLKAKHKQMVTQEILTLRENLLQHKKENTVLNIEQNSFKKQKEQEINALVAKLKTLMQKNHEQEKYFHTLKLQSKKNFSKEKTRLLKEVEQLKQRHVNTLSKQDEKHKEETNHLTSDYEKRIKSMETSFKNQIQHIRSETENDLILEQKRFNLLKKSNIQENTDKGQQITTLQTENQTLKANEKILQTRLQNIEDKWQKGLKHSKTLQAQNKNLKNLWYELQAQNETKTRQIESLQKLNRSLSQSLNDSRIDRHFKPQSQKQNEILISHHNNNGVVLNETSYRPEKQSAQLILADLHFD